MPAQDTGQFDQPFDRPQFLIHATGHGTTSGPVTDDQYILYIEEPDANGVFREADGFGGTITYSSDFHTGPLTTPRSVCDAAATQGLPAQEWTPYNRTNTFDCRLLTGAAQAPSPSGETLSGCTAPPNESAPENSPPGDPPASDRGSAERLGYAHQSTALVPIADQGLQQGKCVTADATHPGTRACCALGRSIPGRPETLEPNALTGHQYGKRFHSDPVGFVYTAKVGLVDLGHVRDNADMTRFIYDALVAGATQLQLYEGTATVNVIPPDTDGKLELAGAITYVESRAHELVTYGTATQDYSAFSPEDLPSNMIGIELAKRAIRQVLEQQPLTTDARYNEAVDAALPALINDLGPRSKADTDAVLKKIEGNWFTRGTIVPTLLRRNFDGTPWMAGMVYDTPETPPWMSPTIFEPIYNRDFTYVISDKWTTTKDKSYDLTGYDISGMKTITEIFQAFNAGKDHP
jgi:hypothetical protein